MSLHLTRRDFVKAAASISAVPTLALASAPSPSSTGPSKRSQPNVILIMLDDLGSVDANCYGSTDLETPNIDALAESGVRFTQFCSAAPVCSPSRAAVLTGRYPQRAGLADNASSRPGGPGLPADEITLAKMFKDCGYATGHVGKWHMGYQPQIMPNAKGFDESFGHMGGCIDNYSHFFYWDGPNRHDLWQNGREIWRDGIHIGDLMVHQCHSFLDANQGKPFFLFWAINQPHYPLQGRPKWREHYKDLPSPRSMYAASVSTLDELIGQVIAKVKELGLAEKTIIALQSDHGHSTEDRAFGGGGNAGPYRGAKFSLFEGGIRVVSLISWPGTLPKDAVRQQLVTGCDWLPTLAELTGVAPPHRRIDGKSMLPVISDANAPTAHPTFFWQLGNQWAAREGNWKLIGNPRDTSNKAPLTAKDKLFLSDLAAGVSEMTNRAAAHPDIVKHLTALHDRWVQDVKDHS
ncbi:MAG TPA: sulfatase-like hydrolase/transferase [Tepidisphaeraceae bacterium]|jgi:arylsulfatase A|nr:sulfatase-like hydrolase/transferase [Tepidisphaeraceae bacterium]